jgi:hypothetical protein
VRSGGRTCPFALVTVLEGKASKYPEDCTEPAWVLKSAREVVEMVDARRAIND